MPTKQLHKFFRKSGDYGLLVNQKYRELNSKCYTVNLSYKSMLLSTSVEERRRSRLYPPLAFLVLNRAVQAAATEAVRERWERRKYPWIWVGDATYHFTPELPDAVTSCLIPRSHESEQIVL